MSAWIPLITQAIPLIIPAIAPFLLRILHAGTGYLGKVIPVGLNPVLNAVFGAALSYLTGSDPTLGAITAHVVRSGLEHEVPALPAATAAGRDVTGQ